MRRTILAAVIIAATFGTGACAIPGEPAPDPCAPLAGQLFNQCATLDMAQIDDQRDHPEPAPRGPRIPLAVPTWAPLTSPYSGAEVIMVDPWQGLVIYADGSYATAPIPTD